MWAPDKLIRTIVKPKYNTQLFHHQLPSTNVEFIYPNSSGLSYEVEAVRQSIINGINVILLTYKLFRSN